MNCDNLRCHTFKKCSCPNGVGLSGSRSVGACDWCERCKPGYALVENGYAYTTSAGSKVPIYKCLKMATCGCPNGTPAKMDPSENRADCYPTSKHVCALEGKKCKCNGMVRYGSDTVTKTSFIPINLGAKWSKWKKSNAEIACTTQEFGDPFPTGVKYTTPPGAKRCECKGSIETRCSKCNPGFLLVPANGPHFKCVKSTRRWDCNGRMDGTATRDVCGVCDSVPGNDGLTCQDCAGVPNGNSTMDFCGTCDTNPNNDCVVTKPPTPAPVLPTLVVDCAGTAGGKKVVDKCGTCDDDSLNDCIKDCKGQWGGKAKVDACGVCGGNGMSCAAKDCNGQPGGTAVLDVCGVCGGDGNLCKTKLCNGQQGQERGQFTVSGCQSIDYHVDVPLGCWKKGCGLIFDVPGRGMSGHEHAAMSGIREAAITPGKQFIIVTPQKSSKSAGYAQGLSKADHPNILQFMQEMVSVYGVDKNHVHVTGFAQGGFASWNMLCLGSNLICSIAPLAAPPFGKKGGCTPPKLIGSKNGYDSTCFAATTLPDTVARRSILFQYGKYDHSCGIKDIVSAVQTTVTKAYGIGQPTKMTSCKISNTDQLELFDATSNLRFQTIKYPYVYTPTTAAAAAGLGHCFPRKGRKPTGRMCETDLLGNDPQYDHGQLVVDFFRANPCSGWGGSCANGALIQQSKRTQNNHCGSCNSGFVLRAKKCLPKPTCPPGQYLDLSLSICKTCGSGTYKSIQGTSSTKCTAKPPCPPGQQLTGSSTTAAGRCSPCPDKFFKATSSIQPCVQWNACTNGEYQKTAGTPTTDRVCASHGQCNANEYEVS
eukprot:COSAG01_NODE_5224_length_4401_cov_157.385170_3_plen_817_part_01